MICEQVARHPGVELRTPALIRASSAPALPGPLHAVVFKSLYWLWHTWGQACCVGERSWHVRRSASIWTWSSTEGSRPRHSSYVITLWSYSYMETYRWYRTNHTTTAATPDTPRCRARALPAQHTVTETRPPTALLRW